MFKLRLLHRMSPVLAVRPEGANHQWRKNPHGELSIDPVRHNDDGVFLYAFDLIELDGDDLRRHSLIVRKMTLVSVLAPAAPGLRLNQHLEADILDVFHHACKLGLEGIVSKQKDSHAPPICVRSYQRTLGQRARARNSQASVGGCVSSAADVAATPHG